MRQKNILIWQRPRAAGRALCLMAIGFLLPLPKAGAESILDSLKEGRESPSALDRRLKKDMASLLAGLPQSKKLARAFDSKQRGEALSLWLEGWHARPFAKTHSGRAIYGLLLFQSGYEAEGLAELFQARPGQIGQAVRGFWKAAAPPGHPAWGRFLISSLKSPPAEWLREWAGFFGEETVFKAGMGSLAAFDMKEGGASRIFLESLLRLPVSGGFDKFPAEWRLIISFVREGDMDSATKLLGWLLKSGASEKKKAMAHLAIARLLAAAGELPAALFYYSKIPESSPLWLEAREETAWIYHQQGQYGQMLAAAAAFEHPGLQAQSSPGMHFALALAYMRNCSYPGALRAILRFKSQFSRKARSGGRRLYVRRALRGDGHLLRLLQFEGYIKSRPAPPGARYKPLRLARARLLSDLRQKARRRGGALAAEAEAEISRASEGISLVEAESLYRIHGFHRRQPARPAAAGGIVSPAGFAARRGIAVFPFHPKEIWKDELSDYKALPRGGCPKKGYVL